MGVIALKKKKRVIRESSSVFQQQIALNRN